MNDSAYHSKAIRILLKMLRVKKRLRLQNEFATQQMHIDFTMLRTELAHLQCLGTVSLRAKILSEGILAERREASSTCIIVNNA